ncbi:MAG: group I truncated hemoglobin [Betaproteobacteria bacterium]
MSKPALPLTMSLLSVLAVAAPICAQAPAPAPPPSQAAVPPVTPSPERQVAALEASCAASAAARASRHAQTPLYQRLRGEQGIHAITRETVRLHLQNPPIRHYFERLDPDAVAKRVAEFMISGTGGPQVYQGPDLTTSHRSMKLTNADFVAAGGDVVQAMKNLKYGQEEIDEVVCTLVSLRSQVVLAP